PAPRPPLHPPPLPDALPISDDRITPREELGIDRALGAPLAPSALGRAQRGPAPAALPGAAIEDNLYRVVVVERAPERVVERPALDRKSTRLNSSHEWISYAV